MRRRGAAGTPRINTDKHGSDIADKTSAFAAAKTLKN